MAGVCIDINDKFRLDLELHSRHGKIQISCDVVLTSLGVHDLRIGATSIGPVEFTETSHETTETRHSF
jgi:hypothetical protein